MFEQSPCTPLFPPVESDWASQSKHILGHRREAREGRGKPFQRCTTSGEDQLRKTAGETETRESESLRGKPRV